MTRGEWLGWAGCVLIGVGLALAPHFANLAAYGTFEFLADNDDIYYLAIARAPYHGEWTLRDPLVSPDDHVPSLYAWGQFVPLAKLTASLGLGPLMMAAVWRGVGGFLLASALYWLFRRLFNDLHRPALAVLCTLLCLTDTGFVSGRPVIDTLRLGLRPTAITSTKGTQRVLPQYRIVTPLTNLPFLIALATCLLPAPFRPRWSTLLGSASLCACIWLYFYYWTAAVIAGAMLIGFWMTLAVAVRGYRVNALREVRTLVSIGLVGLCGGAPQIIGNIRTSRDPDLQPAFERLERGEHIPVGHPVRTQYLPNVWSWAELIIGSVSICRFRLHRLAPIWCLVAASFALKNSAMITGLEFENFHWGGYVTAPFGEILLVAIIVLLAERWGWGRIVTMALAIVISVTLPIVAALRPYEALRDPQSARNTAVLTELRQLQLLLEKLNPKDVLSGPDDSRVALLIGHSAHLYNNPNARGSLITDDAVHQRAALNAWLTGVTREEYAALAYDGRFQVGSVERPEWGRSAVTSARLAWFDKLEADGGRPLLDRYHPNVLLMPHGHSPPRPSGAWRLRRESGHWDLWERTP